MTIKNLIPAFLIIILSLFANTAYGQDWKTDKKVNVVFGLTQPLFVNGFNIEGNYIHNRLIFDYSHGASLDFSGTSLPEDLNRQGLAVHMPWTTGFGIGYRLKQWINVRFEPKWHRFEYFYEGELRNAENEIISINTMSVGIGFYGHFEPFKNQNSFLKGFMIAPSIRFWPTVSSSLEDNSYTYFNSKTMQNEEINTPDPGFGFTPFVFNISIGYSFDLRKKQ
jgi:hypothetical protein